MRGGGVYDRKSGRTVRRKSEQKSDRRQSVRGDASTIDKGRGRGNDDFAASAARAAAGYGVERSDTGGTRNVDDASTVERAATTTENETAHDAATHESEDERATKIFHDGGSEDAPERKSRRDETKQKRRRRFESNRRTEGTTEFTNAARRDAPKQRKRERKK